MKHKQVKCTHSLSDPALTFDMVKELNERELGTEVSIEKLIGRSSSNPMREQTKKNLILQNYGIPNLKRRMMTRASRPEFRRISSSETPRARGIHEKEGTKSRLKEMGS